MIVRTFTTGTTGLASHFAVKVLSAVMAVLKSNFVSPSNQPKKLYPSFVGSAGLVTFSFSTTFTSVSISPFLKVTVYFVGSAFHCPSKVVSSVIVILSVVTLVPSLDQPSKI